MEVKKGIYKKTNSISYKPSPPLQSLTNSFKTVYKKAKENLGKIGIGIYEGILLKYLYDLNTVFSDKVVKMAVNRNRLPLAPVRAELFPWPTLYKPWIEPEPNVLLLTRPMNWIEQGIKFFYESPILQAVAFLTPFIIWGAYHETRKYMSKKESKE